jgi:hypothetical protein
MTKTSAKKASGTKQPAAQPRRRTASPARQSKPKIQRSGGTESAKATKIGSLIAQLRHGRGASLIEIADATGWQHHSIRGAISGHIKKKLGLKVASTKDDEGVRRYRIAG